MKRQDSHDFMGDRYKYDCGMCSYKRGFAQVDTRQDAPYFGMWANPEKRQIVTFCEGDVTIQTADTDAEFAQALYEIKKYYGETFIGIDPGFRDNAMKKRFVALGVSDLLH